MYRVKIAVQILMALTIQYVITLELMLVISTYLYIAACLKSSEHKHKAQA